MWIFCEQFIAGAGTRKRWTDNAAHGLGQRVQQRRVFLFQGDRPGLQTGGFPHGLHQKIQLIRLTADTL